MNQTLDRIVSLLFPKGCVLCGKVVAYDDLICTGCRPDRPEGELCDPCGRLLESCVCVQNRPWAFLRAVSALHYRGGTREALIRLKKTPDPRIIRFFAEEMALAIRNIPPDIKFDLVTEVPMHSEKLEARGFNQAEALAAQVAALLGSPHMPGILECYTDTTAQHTLRREERFSAAETRYRLAAGQISGKTILLVDDIMTTGATIDACARRLMSGGAEAVWALAAAGTDRTACDVAQKNAADAPPATYIAGALDLTAEID